MWVPHWFGQVGSLGKLPGFFLGRSCAGSGVSVINAEFMDISEARHTQGSVWAPRGRFASAVHPNFKRGGLAMAKMRSN